MREFGLSLPEVRNKIRIFRTTYNQEKKKEDTILNYRPKLSWYQDMKNAFDTGKIKSFVKTPGKIKVELDREKSHAIHYEFENEDQMTPDENDERERSQIIIEPYEEYEVEEDEDDIDINKKDDENHNQHNNSSNQPPLTSNELFLQSLKSSLDRLSEEKNMRARIAIQEALYKIMYEK